MGVREFVAHIGGGCVCISVKVGVISGEFEYVCVCARKRGRQVEEIWQRYFVS